MNHARTVWPRALRYSLLAILWCTSMVQANGGTQQLTLAPAGPYEVTALTSPTPVRPGLVDVSVLVYEAHTERLVRDALVSVTAQELGQVLPSVIFPATHDRASNPLYYAADIEVPRPGRWRLTIQVSSQLGQGTAAFDVDVAQGDPAEGVRYWLLRAAYPVIVAAAWLRQAPPVMVLGGLLLSCLALIWWSRFRRAAPPRQPQDSQHEQDNGENQAG